MFVIGDRGEVALVVHAVEGVGDVADVVDEKNAVEVVNFVEESAGEVAAGFEADFGAVFEKSLDLGFVRATDQTVNFWN